MYTDQFKTKESLTYYAFDILKSIASNLRFDESKKKYDLYDYELYEKGKL